MPALSRFDREISRRTALRGLLAGSAAVGLPALLAACARGTSSTAKPLSAQKPVRGGTFISALYLEPTAIDPDREYFWETYRVSRNIYENLVQEDLAAPHGTAAPALVPGLATAWTPAPDFSKWTFTLRQGVKFHDGTSFNAQALDFNIRRFTDKTFKYYDSVSAGIMSARFDDLKAATVEGDYSYSFEFNHPYIGFPRLLAQSISSPLIFSPAALEKYGQNGLSSHPVGTGPYTFVNRVIGDHITLQRNPHYWGEQPYLDEIVFRIILDDQTRLAALESGQVHFISRVEPTDVQSLLSKGFNVPSGHGAQLDYILWNFANKFVQDPAVRKAVAQGINLPGDVQDIYDGYALALRSFLPPGNVAYVSDADYGYTYDLDAAKAGLTAAGYKDGDVSFNIVTDLEGEPEAAYLANNLKGVGISASVVALDRSTYVTRTSNPEPDDGISLDEYGGTYPEWVSEAYQSEVIARGGQKYVDDATIQQAINTARYNPNEADYVSLWQAADKALVDSAAVIPTVNFTRYYAYSTKVQGFVWPNTNWYDLSKVWLTSA